MATLSEHSDVYNTALLILQRKGYQIWYEKRTKLYCAERDGWDFKSDSPCGLLGLVAIYEFKHPNTYTEYWWREEGERLYGQERGNPTPYKCVMDP